MLTLPNGELAGKTDRVMVLALWMQHLVAKGVKIIAAGMGKPTLAMNEMVAAAAQRRWSNIGFTAQAAHHYLRSNGNSAETRNVLVRMGGVVDYGHPQGDLVNRELMAKALKKWYRNKIDFKPQDILFTVGGAGAIHNVLTVFSNRYPDKLIVTPFPHYSLYATSVKSTRLHPIDVMKESGYRLTAAALNSSIGKLKDPQEEIGAFLFCDPNNPLGTIVGESAWLEIAEVLKKYPNALIILDEAYAEMCLDGHHYMSLLECAPELHHRVVLLRSATKALSAAGERMAIISTPDERLMSELLTSNIDICGHAPRSHQEMFAYALDSFRDSDREELATFYGEQVKTMHQSLIRIGASMPDVNHKTEGTFYALADLHDLMGLDIPADVSIALGRRGKIETDEDIAYYLLFRGVMIAPLSYFGANPHAGFFRITCSNGDDEIKALCDVLEVELINARKMKKTILTTSIIQSIDKLTIINTTESLGSVQRVRRAYSKIFSPISTSQNVFELKVALEQYRRCLEEVRAELSREYLAAFNAAYGPFTSKNKIAFFNRISGPDRSCAEKAVIFTQSLFRRRQAVNKLKQFKVSEAVEWQQWVEETYKGSSNKMLGDENKKLRACLLTFTPSERHAHKPWLDYLKQKSLNQPSPQSSPAKSPASKSNQASPTLKFK